MTPKSNPHSAPAENPATSAPATAPDPPSLRSIPYRWPRSIASSREAATETSPPIAQAQNRSDSLRRIAAQARAYTEVKQALWLRLGVVTLLALAVSVAAVASRDQGLIGSAGGFVLLFVNAVLAHRQRRRAEFAASVQEAFDCDVFKLRWNDALLLPRPSGQEVALAAARYTGNRNRDWYPDTGTVRRPLDILICQQSNVGWGAPVHRAWAWVITVASATVVIAIAVVWIATELPAGRGFGILVAPFLPLAWEAFEMARDNFESAQEKEQTQALILSEWDAAMHTGELPNVDRCRAFQDAIAAVRRRNAQVPDWFDGRLRDRNEKAMRTSADEMIQQATRAGLT